MCVVFNLRPPDLTAGGARILAARSSATALCSEGRRATSDQRASTNVLADGRLTHRHSEPGRWKGILASLQMEGSMTSARHEPTTRSKGAVPQSKRAAAVVKAAVHPEVTGTLAFQPWAAASRASWSPRLVDLLECQYADGQTGYLVISHAEAENPADPAPAGLGYEEHARNAPKGGWVVVSERGQRGAPGYSSARGVRQGRRKRRRRLGSRNPGTAAAAQESAGPWRARHDAGARQREKEACEGSGDRAGVESAPLRSGKSDGAAMGGQSI